MLGTTYAATTVLYPYGGGTGVSQPATGLIYSNGGNNPMTSTSSPTVASITATSTTATSTFSGGVNIGGFVGIGTSSPITPLEIPGSTTNSSVKFGTFELQSYAINNAWLTDNLYYNGGFKYRTNGYGVISYFINGNYSIKMATNGVAGNTAVTRDRFVIQNTGNIGLGGTIASNLDLSGAGMVVLATGNVGIGTTTPQALLHVNVSSIEGTPVIDSTASAVFQRNASSASNNLVSIIAGSAGLAQLGFGDKDAATVGLLQFDNISNKFALMNGYLGIGTTSPSSQLEVIGSAGTGLPVAGAGMISVLSSTNGNGDGGGIIFGNKLQPAGFAGIKGSLTNGSGGTTAGDLAFYTRRLISDANQTEAMRILTNGNIGIGTSTATSKLEVAGNIALNKFYAGTAVDRYMGIGNGTGGVGTGWWGGIGFSESATNDSILRFFTSSVGGSATEKMTLLGNGNVGIGTTSPATRLNIAEFVGGTPVVMRLTASNSGIGELGRISSYNAVGTQLEASSISFLRDDNSDGYYGALAFNTKNNVERMRIASGGLVGIGTSTPARTLDMYTTGAASIGLQSAGTNYSALIATNNGGRLVSGLENSAGSILMGGTLPYAGVINSNATALQLGSGNVTQTITPGGFVGIGTTSPMGTLSIDVGAAKGIVIGQNQQNTTYNGLSFNGNLTDLRLIGFFGGGDTNFYIQTITDMIFRNSGGTTRMTLSQNGNLGLGTTTPFGKLSVTGRSGINTPIFIVASSTNVSQFAIGKSGHVMTGGTAPTVSSCGPGATIFGDDNTWRVHIGTGAVTSCVITFANAWVTTTGRTVTPTCQLNGEGPTGADSFTASSTPTNTTIYHTGSMAEETYSAMCRASDNFTE